MRKILFLFPATALILPAIFCGCSKSVTEQNAQPETTLKFKVNGIVYEWRNKGFCGIYCGTSIEKWPDYYNFDSFDPRDYQNNFSFTLSVTSLGVSSYNYPVTSPVTSSNALHRLNLFNPVSGGSFSHAASTEIGDFATITITNIHDGKYADGFFTARLTLSPYGVSADKADITEGEFHNVIIYQ